MVRTRPPNAGLVLWVQLLLCSMDFRRKGVPNTGMSRQCFGSSLGHSQCVSGVFLACWASPRSITSSRGSSQLRPARSVGDVLEYFSGPEHIDLKPTSSNPADHSDASRGQPNGIPRCMCARSDCCFESARGMSAANIVSSNAGYSGTPLWKLKQQGARARAHARWCRASASSARGRPSTMVAAGLCPSRPLWDPGSKVEGGQAWR